jgi:DNA-binding response OmpR family regulator
MITMVVLSSDVQCAPKRQNVGAILVVEDLVVRNFLRMTLERRGYEVICAEPPDALQLLRDGACPVDLLITNTPSLFTGFLDVPVLYLAACPDPAVTQEFRECIALRKPFHPAQLMNHVADLMSKRPGPRTE